MPQFIHDIVEWVRETGQEVLAGMTHARLSMIGLGIALAAFLMLLFASCTPAFAGDKLVEMFERLEQSTGALYKQHNDGSLQFLCSITAVDEHAGETVLLTAYHCVQRGVSYRVTLDGENFVAARVWKIPGYEADGKKYPRAYHDPKVDMALFLSKVDVPTVDLAIDGARRKPGHDVIMTGFPLGQAKISYRGGVAGYFDRPGNERNGYQILQIFGAPGSSGSSVIDAETGKVISILVAAQQGRAGLPVIFATPIEYRTYLREVPTGKREEVGNEDAP